MTTPIRELSGGVKNLLQWVAMLVAMLFVSWPNHAQAIPLFARQTGWPVVVLKLHEPLT